ncbi:hypothetical protein BN12_40054 [Nostocoides japonicum T1-X7]|uniref:Tail terminator n=1 Tax=Nostocoides japonicum T1-X7 TaxID=1194083 RepID=A0A077M4Q0_9MICO|nr:hypothetical protein [Tetrasphaera japonica]CCH79084.1 hypothetical protein BN12_40054 [Tetrasphaera japonica T1-X7]
MTARAAVADLLTEHLPDDVDVIPYARNIDSPARSTVMLRLDEVTPGVASGLGTYTFALLLIAAKTSPGPADDELDALLEDVLYALDRLSDAGVTWSSARRATYEDKNPAYEVTTAVTVSKSDPE